MSLNLKGRYNLLRQAVLLMVGIPDDSVKELKEMTVHIRAVAFLDPNSAPCLLVLQTLIATHDEECKLPVASRDIPDAWVERLKDSLWSTWGERRQTTDWPTDEQLCAALRNAIWGNSK